MPPKTRPAARKTRRKDRKNVTHGHAYIKSTFNNTIVSLTDPQGAVIAWCSSGQVGFKGSRKSTPYAAQLAAEAAARRAQEHGMKKVDVFVKGPGSGRETAIRSLQAAGLEVGSITTSPPRPSTVAARPSAAASELHGTTAQPVLRRRLTTFRPHGGTRSRAGPVGPAAPPMRNGVI